MTFIEQIQDIDRFQGDDPEILKIRERLPEPSRVEGFIWSVPLYRPLTAWLEFPDEKSMLEPTPRVDFIKTMMGINHSHFLVWKCSRDGKIYM